MNIYILIYTVRRNDYKIKVMNIKVRKIEIVKR